MFERFRKPIAITGATIALGAGALKASRAEAMDSSASCTHSNTNIYHKKGIHELNSETAVEAEAAQALGHLKERWHGVLVLQEPKQDALISFKESPTGAIMVNSKYHYVKCTDHGGIFPDVGIERFKGRDYAVIFDPETARYGFLDIAIARSVGSLSMYAYKGESPHPYKMDLDNQSYPVATKVGPIDPWDVTSIKVDGKVKKLVPSDIVPHP